MEKSVREISAFLDGQIIGNHEKKIIGIAVLEEATETEISFVTNKKYLQKALETKAGALILSEKIQTNATQILVKDSYLAFAKVMSLFFVENLVPKISQTAKIHKTAFLGKNVFIDENVFIGENCEIGENTKIFPNVTIYPNTKIGEFCRIHSGTVIGSDGFGFVPTENSVLKIPQTGFVKIGNFVEIGANCTINCGTLASTEIGDFVKLDSQVHIGHNVKIGKCTLIAAQTGISGSTEIGKFVQIGGQVGIGGHLKIGDFAKIGGKSGVTKNVKENEIMFGYPAREINLTKKIEAILRKMAKK